MAPISFRTGFKVAFLSALVFGALLGALTYHVQAAQSTAQTFVVQAGGQGPGNVDVLQFAPQSLKIHRGDTVTWSINSFHDIRFDNKRAALVVTANDGGKSIPAFNPAVALPTIQSGSTYHGGIAGSGLPSANRPPLFSLVMDLAPGTYSYLCDVHQGMGGVIIVVPDGDAIPGPGQVDLEASTELGNSVRTASTALARLDMGRSSSRGAMNAGTADTGRGAINQYFPFTTTIKAGQSVTWTVPASSIESHTISWPPIRGQDIEPIPVTGKSPILAVGKTLLPLTQSGTTVKTGESFSSGMLTPGKSFTLTFAQPGIYLFECNIHPGMNGVVIVQ